MPYGSKAGSSGKKPTTAGLMKKKQEVMSKAKKLANKKRGKK